MTLPVSRSRPTSPAGSDPARPDPASNDPASHDPATDSAVRVPTVHRLGALLVAAVLAAFGILGFLGGLPFFSTAGDPVLGMSSNGLLSTISLITAAVLVAAVISGPRLTSTVMLVVGVLFLLSALGNLAVLRTSANVLAFGLSNVAFSVGAGLLLLLLGAYGRIGGHLPADSPYASEPAGELDSYPVDEAPHTPADVAAEREMRAAEIAVVQHTATPDQQRRVTAMSRVSRRLDRRRVWLDSGPTG